MLKVHVSLWINIIESITHICRVIKNLVWISTKLFLFSTRKSLTGSLLLAKVSNLKFFIVFTCRTLHDTLTCISSSIELDRLLCLSDYRWSHELIYLLVCFLNLRSKEILNLLLISCKSWGIWLSLLLCRKRPAWRWSLKLFSLSLSNSRLFSLRKRRLVWLNSKRDYASSNLNCLCHLWLKFNLALGEYKSSKLRQIIF